MKRSRIDSIRESLRLQQVYNVFLRYGWDTAFSRWRLLGRLRHSMQRWVWHLPDEVAEPTTPAKTRLLLEELGPTYVKMGQIVSSQASVIPPEWEVELEKLQSDVPPFPADQVREILEEELGAAPEHLFASFEIEPLAAASTAQVHRATLYSGDQVVVKVQRPGIQSQMKADLGIMQRAAGVATRRSEDLRAVDLEGMIEQFSESVLNELDLLGEAYNAIRLSENMASLEGVHIPQMYPELSASRVLTMEFIKGVKISDIQAIEAAGLERETIARNALRAVIKQLLIDGFFHADPHPGNILVNLQTGQITFLDTGMVGQLDLIQRVNLIQLIFAVQQRDVAGMGQILSNLSVPFVKSVDEKAYARDFDRVISRQLYVASSTGFGQIVTMALDLLRSHGLRLNPNLTMAVKALMQAEAFVTLLYPEGGIVQEGTEMIREMVLDEVTAEKVVDVVKDQVMMSAREVLKRLPSLQEATVSWLDQYQKGRFEVYMDTSGLDKSVDKLARLGRQVVIALMLVGMIVGSAIATSVIAFLQPEAQYWTFASRLAYLGFVVPMVVAILIVFRLLWRWIRGDKAVQD
ncbi:MAG: AarF/UbiB family protein [Chloroflexota bacterium]|nr:AarF/UbiB family protein [Chloroflexota bacterium]